MVAIPRAVCGMDRYTGARGRDPSYFDTRTITLLNRIASNRRVGDQSSHGNHGRPSTSGAAGADGRWGAGAQLGAGQLPRAGRRRGGSGDNMDVRPVTPLALLGTLGSDHLPSNMVCVLVSSCNVLLLAVCSPPRPPVVSHVAVWAGHLPTHCLPTSATTGSCSMHKTPVQSVTGRVRRGQ